MRNVQSGHSLRMTMPEVHGTRSSEMAMFVIYNEPLKMLCDAPSVYEREPEITSFISKIPTVWDYTKVLEAQFGEYLVEARQTGKTWYVAGMNGETAREVTIDFSFLGEGSFTAQILKDGPNADRIGTDYLHETLPITKNSKLICSSGYAKRSQPLVLICNRHLFSQGFIIQNKYYSLSKHCLLFI